MKYDYNEQLFDMSIPEHKAEYEALLDRDDVRICSFDRTFDIGSKDWTVKVRWVVETAPTEGVSND